MTECDLTHPDFRILALLKCKGFVSSDSGKIYMAWIRISSSLESGKKKIYMAWIRISSCSVSFVSLF